MKVHPRAVGRHTSIQNVMQFFDSDHLPDNLKPIAEYAEELAYHMLANIPDDNPQLTIGLNKLIEAKDCFVRAKLVSDG